MSRGIHESTLRPANENVRHATWLELFFDLVFVMIITELGTRLSHDLTYIGIFKFVALFAPVIWMWASYTVFAARFDNNDTIHWVMTFIIMFAGIIVAIQIPVALEKGSVGFTIGFLITQISLLLLYARSFHDHIAQKNLILFYLAGYGSGTLFWLISLFFYPPTKFVFWGLGMLFFLSMPWLGRKRILSKSPLDTAYIPERFGLFTIIILGQTIASVVIGLKFANWNFYSIIISILAFILAIIIWGQYYRFIRIANYKCTLSSGQPYIYAHIPLLIGLVILGVCSEYFIKTPELVNQKVNIIFCFAAILYLTSFYLLQYITLSNFQIRGISYIFGMITILTLLSYPLSSFEIMICLVFIFMILFSIQYWLGSRVLSK